ncbi:HD domain-containing phosphohydrolase [Chromobacterium piscinae]|uniref:HD domain-containing phosphohydrolase n=3 Tax=Chromobacterium piscinae TaxID=686831 RepID=A0ABV0H0A5_9NEIS|nr:HD domain-containing phosphohydrolase [Chromobacterium piscinae]MCD5326673.1 Hpt domain-containing protein [Chromobacterium piscinae]NHQ80311.1 HD domain-containing protein [Chromobacterium vaccinii]
MATQQLMPEIIDPIAFQDFRDAVSDYAPQLEQLVCQLEDGSGNGEKIAQLFRILHSIKGDASLCQVHFVEPYVHVLEHLLDRVRRKELPYLDVLGDVLLLVMDRLVLMLDAVADDAPLDDLRMDALRMRLDPLLDKSAEELPQACAWLVASMMGHPPVVAQAAAEQTGTHGGHRFADLQFFRSLAVQLEHRLPAYAGRTERNLALALETNRLAKQPLPMEQLAAAIYMHDIGMMLLPESMWLKAGQLSDEERRDMSAHPGWAAGLLERMPGWEEAAAMVAQHHERPDGSGYPDGLRDGAICSGACVLALVDAFESVMLKHAQQGQRRSMLRAVAELNASERQFDPYWLQLFNQVVRTRLELGNVVGGA